MDRGYWGVDSASPFNVVKMKTLPRKPYFWIRYLNNTPGVCTGLSKSELDTILSNGIAVGLVDSGLFQTTLEVDNRTMRGYVNANVSRIVNTLKSLQLPISKHVVYFDLEGGTNPSDSLFEYLVHTALAAHINPGIYYNPNLQSHNLVAARFAHKWTSEPDFSKWSNVVLNFDESLPQPGVRLRQYAIGQNNDYVDYDTIHQSAYDLLIHPPQTKPTLQQVNNELHNAETIIQRYED